MKARRMIFEGGFGPEDIEFLTEILENVWEEVEPDSLQNGLEKSNSREKLASIIIAMARGSSRETPEEFRDRVRQTYLEQTHWTGPDDGARRYHLGSHPSSTSAEE